MRLLADGRFAALLDAAPDAMVCVDRDGWIITVNVQEDNLDDEALDHLLAIDSGDAPSPDSEN